MHALRLLHKRLADALPEMHVARLGSLVAAVGGLVNGQQLWLSGVGRHLAGPVDEKHKIKRIDRLLGNTRLYQERRSVYRWLSRLLLAQCRQPCVIVDWSDIDPGRKLYLLRAAVSVGGRALPLYEEVYTRYHHRADTEAFLRHLATLLPPGCVPIIVTDAGFRSPWFKAIEALGWYYVGRVRNRDHVRFPGTGAWIPGKALYDRATPRPRALGQLSIPRSAPMSTRAYLVRKPAAGRHRLNVYGHRRQNAASKKAASREREPWLLVSNLPVSRGIAKRVVAIYRDRMSIEQGFRDLKAHRHGFAFRSNLGRHPQRIANLLLIAALAVLVIWLTGLAGIAARLHRGMQANTEKRRRVLSTFFIGIRMIQRRYRLTLEQFLDGMQQLQQCIRERNYETG